MFFRFVLLNFLRQIGIKRLKNEEKKQSIKGLRMAGREKSLILYTIERPLNSIGTKLTTYVS